MAVSQQGKGKEDDEIEAVQEIIDTLENLALATTNDKTIVAQLVAINSKLTASIVTLTANNKSLTEKLKVSLDT